MLALNLILALFVCFGTIVMNANAFHSRYFDSYEDDWRARRVFKRPLGPVASESVEVPIEEVKPVEVAPESYESAERYRPRYGRPSYYEPRPFYGGGSSYGYRPRYGKK